MNSNSIISNRKLTLRESFDVASDVFSPEACVSAHLTEDLDKLSTNANLFPQNVSGCHVAVETTGLITGKRKPNLYQFINEFSYILFTTY